MTYKRTRRETLLTIGRFYYRHLRTRAGGLTIKREFGVKK